MSSKVCPKTCGRLSTAAVFISIGVVQFLAGVILLKSEYVYLLAGMDFLAAISNASVGSFLGISSSIWENKSKQMSGKNIARQNILAGLYISVIVVNATAAIVMIMGDGNKLLTVMENVDRNNSAVLVFEIMACAYVTSVCSPIVCIVVALVGLSGNRIQIHGNRKERESIVKTESYGWVFQNNHGSGPKKLSDVIYSPSNRNSSGSDEVFLDKYCMSKKSFLKKFSKKSHSRNSISSLRELQSPLAIWDYKRKKILQEITEPNKTFFNDDYLHFPDFNYGSYVGTILPRIKQTSLIPLNSRTSTGPVKEGNKALQMQPDEVDTKLTGEKLEESYQDKTFQNRTTQHSGEVTDAMKKYDSIQYKNEKCRKNSNGGIRPTAPNRYTNSRSTYFSGKPPKPDSTLSFKSEKPTPILSPSQVDVESQRDVQNSTEPSVFEIKSEAIDELKSKFNEMGFEESLAIGDRKEFMKSFKNLKCKRSEQCETNVGHESDSIQNSSGRIALCENVELNGIQKSTSWAGKVVPIAVRSPSIGTGSSIPVSTVTSRVNQPVECQPMTEDSTKSDSLTENIRDSNDYQKLTGDIESGQTGISLYDRIDKLEQLNLDLPPDQISSSGPLESQKSVGRSILSSIPESSTEGAIAECSTAENETFVTTKRNSEFKLSRANTCKTNTSTTLPKHSRLKTTQSTHLLKRLWSIVGNEDKTDISNLVMDADSLVGLSDEELMNRTSRLREIRKSVIMRSKNEGLEISN